MKSLKALLVIAVSIFSLQFCCGQNTGKSPATVALETEMKLLRNVGCMKNASWSLCVLDIRSGKVLTQYDSETSLMPASMLKLATTSVALALLDSNFTFETRLQYTGTIDQSSKTLKGDLFLTGGGDPAIGSKCFGNEVSVDSVFAKFLNALKKKGIKSIEGSVIADESIFDDLPPQSWGWEDVGNYYGSGACGLSINENSYRLYFEAGNAIGDPAKVIRVDPPMPEIKFINNVKTAEASTGDNVFIFGGPYSYEKILEGTIPLGKKNFDVDGAIPDPAMYFTRLFSDYLIKNGITISKRYTTLRQERWNSISGSPDTSARTDLCVHQSPPLKDIVYHTNMKSVNMFAETLLKMTGYKMSGHGTTQAGINAVRAYWQSKKINLKGFEMFDGCGLSRKNKITTLVVCQILSASFRTPVFSTFLKSLPVAGESGGMKNLLTGTFAEGNLAAKTGNMDDVKSYAGYVTTKSNQELAFAIIMNNFSCSNAEIKQKCEKLMQLISELD